MIFCKDVLKIIFNQISVIYGKISYKPQKSQEDLLFIKYPTSISHMPLDFIKALLGKKVFGQDIYKTFSYKIHDFFQEVLVIFF